MTCTCYSVAKVSTEATMAKLIQRTGLFVAHPEAVVVTTEAAVVVATEAVVVAIEAVVVAIEAVVVAIEAVIVVPEAVTPETDDAATTVASLVSLPSLILSWLFLLVGKADDAPVVGVVITDAVDSMTVVLAGVELARFYLTTFYVCSLR